MGGWTIHESVAALERQSNRLEPFGGSQSHFVGRIDARRTATGARDARQRADSRRRHAPQSRIVP